MNFSNISRRTLFLPLLLTISAVALCVGTTVYLAHYASPPFGQPRASLIALVRAITTGTALGVVLALGLSAMFRLRARVAARSNGWDAALLTVGAISNVWALALPPAASFIYLRLTSADSSADPVFAWGGLQTFLLLLLAGYVGLFALRSALSDPIHRAGGTAIYSIVLLLMSPVLFYAATWWGGRAEVLLEQARTGVLLDGTVPSFTTLSGLPALGYLLVASCWGALTAALASWVGHVAVLHDAQAELREALL